jgi:protein-S-isoprenylcysteine O-methyltransferase Ste14
MSDRQRILTPRVIVQLLVFIVIVPFLPLLISWRWDWWQAWVYAFVNIGGFVVSRVLAARRDPGVISERARFLRHEDAAPWDRVLAPLVGLGGGLIPLVAGLDARFGWSPGFGLAVELVALLAILAGYAIGAWALVENPFFSGMVRIQEERDHRVISSGPYRWVRHPGYAGALLTYVATPLFLDSLWAYVPVLFLAVVLVIRTRLEDRTLREQLNGYKGYAQRVRYRLLPRVW